MCPVSHLVEIVFSELIGTRIAWRDITDLSFISSSNRFGRFMAKKELSFVPPDGPFTLMDYRVERPHGISLSSAGLVPITLKPIVQLTEEGGKL